MENKNLATITKLFLISFLAVLLRLAALRLIGDSRPPWEIEFEVIADFLVSRGEYLYHFYRLTPPLPTSFIPPVYPLLMAFFRGMFVENGDLALKLFQVGCSVLTLYALYRFTLELGGSENAGFLTALFWAVYPPAVSYALDLSTVTLEVLFVVVGLWFTVRAGKLASAGSVAVAAGSLALAALTRPTWVAVLPVAFLWLMFYDQKTWKLQWKFPALFFITATIVYAPWLVYNYQTHGSLVLTSTNGGINFWIGNNPNADGEYTFPTAIDRELVLSTVQMTELERDQFFYRLGTEFIRENPQQFFQLTTRKLLYYVFFRPNIGSNYESSNYQLFDLVRWVFVISWMIMLPFAVLGLWIGREAWRINGFLFLVLFSQAAISSLYFTGTRFRTPLDGIVGMWAVFGFLFLVEKILGRWKNDAKRA
jgi:hypothetical protein